MTTSKPWLARHVTIATVLCVLGPVPAMAQVQANPGGPYLGVGWGQFSVHVDNLSDAGTTANRIINSNDNAWKAFAGWRFNPYVGLEMAYINLGSPGDRFEGSGSNGNYVLDVSGFSPSLIGTLPLGPVELFAKAGYYFYDVKLRVDLDAPGPDLRSKSSRDDFIYGGGIGVTFAEHLHVRAEYEVIDLKNASNSDALWLSAAWRF
ncbi:MAG: porin family protein [Steroidobacteraceae bacterium]